MKKVIMILMAAVALAGCQKKEETPSVPSVSQQRRDIGHKLILKSIQDLEAKDLKGAVISLEESIKANPVDPDAYLLMGQILLKVGEYEHAAQFLDQTVKLFPNNGTAFYMMSVANRMTGKKLPAVLAARRSAEIFQVEKDKDNFLKSSALLQDLISTSDDQFTAAANQMAEKAAAVKE